MHVCADITNEPALGEIFAIHAPEAVMHLAAESHVDRSIDNPTPFMTTNIMGTFLLLEAMRAYWQKLKMKQKKAFRFHHISTDEVFGVLSANNPPFTTASAYDPRSPYSVSKAASDHLVRAWYHTYLSARKTSSFMAGI